MKSFRYLIFLFLFSLPSFATNESYRFQYRIKELTGRMLAWRPDATEWEELAVGKAMPEGTLVQLIGESVAKIEIRKTSLDAGDISVNQVKIKKPLVIRLEEGLMRKSKLASFFLPDMDLRGEEENAHESKKKKKEPTPELVFLLNEAWQRFSALFLKKDGEDPTKKFKELAGKSDNVAEESIASRNINLFAPADGSIVLVNHFPLVIHMAWEQIQEKNLKYEIRVWAETETQDKPVAITQEDEYTVYLNESGKTYFQIATTDGRYQSQVHKVDIVMPLVSDNQKKEEREKVENPDLVLLTPPADLTFVSANDSALFTFSWELAMPQFDNFEYQLILSTSAGIDFFKETMTQRVAQVKLVDPGDYSWRVEATQISPTADGSTPFKKTSEKRNFSYYPKWKLDPSTHIDAFDLFGTLLARKNGKFYIEGGL